MFKLFCIHKWSYWDGVYKIDSSMSRFRHLNNRLVPNKFRKCDKCGKTQKRNNYKKWTTKEINLKSNPVELHLRFLGSQKETKSEKRDRILKDILDE